MPRRQNGASAFRLARQLVDEGRYAEALNALEPLVAAQRPEAMGLLGSMYFLGMGLPSDGHRAVELLQGAADRGDGLAAHNLGVLFQTGMTDVSANQKRAKYYYALAQQLGCRLFPAESYRPKAGSPSASKPSREAARPKTHRRKGKQRMKP